MGYEPTEEGFKWLKQTRETVDAIAQDVWAFHAEAGKAYRAANPPPVDPVEERLRELQRFHDEFVMKAQLLAGAGEAFLMSIQPPGGGAKRANESLAGAGGTPLVKGAVRSSAKELVEKAAEVAPKTRGSRTLQALQANAAEQEAAALRLAQKDAGIQASLRISKIAPDYATKGVHIHVNGVELKVLPGEGGTVVFKPVFSSQEKVAGPAIKEAQRALADPAFRRQLHNTATSATEYLRQSGLPGAAAKSGETRFLRIALEKMGLN